MKNILFNTALISLISLSACGGGSSDSGSGIVVEGTLTQGDVAGAERTHDPRVLHGAGQTIEHVEICAMGQCSTTDDHGQWGFALDKSFSGGEVLFSVVGHGIDDEVVVTIPAGHSNVTVELVNGANGVEAHHVSGGAEHNETESDHDHSEHA